MYCLCGLITYPNAEAAWRAARNLGNPRALLRHKRLHKRNQVYRCPICNAWHLTSRPHPKRPKPVEPLHTTQRINIQRIMQEATI